MRIQRSRTAKLKLAIGAIIVIVMCLGIWLVARLRGVPLIGKWHNYNDVAMEMRRIEFTQDGRILDTDAIGSWVTRYTVVKPGLLQISRAGMIDQVNFRIEGDKLYLYHGPPDSRQRGDPFTRD